MHSPEHFRGEGEKIKHVKEFGKVDGIVHVEDEFRPKFLQEPRIHQFIRDGTLHRSPSERPIDPFELFLDLVLVGVVHQFADTAAEEGIASGRKLVRFILSFTGAWSLWSDYSHYVNMSGLDDFPQRVYTFCTMAILIGFSANCTGIPLTQEEFDDHIGKGSLRGALGFFLVGKCIKFILHMYYGLRLRSFLLDQWFRAFRLLIFAALCLGAMFSPKLYISAILYGVGYLTDVFQPLVITALVRIFNYGRSLRTVTIADDSQGITDPSVRLPAFAVYNIEHFSERHAAFYTIVLGESIASLLYVIHDTEGTARNSVPPDARVGINATYGRAFMVLLTTFLLGWLYFTRDWGASKIHPVRRHWFTFFIYVNVHWPLCAALNLASGAVTRMVKYSDIDGHSGLEWYWGGGIATAMVCLAVYDMSYKWDFMTTRRWMVWSVRIFFRLGIAAACAILPLAYGTLVDSLDDLQFVSIYACFMVFLVAEELIGKLVRNEALC
ncbi:hypothetical protein MVES_002388 [Malassezia vespertilionis]|uniref:Uncharacterized protein n=1 Tax=Malassezia vespertilionis TaxID=2020962 RepID=A0A2N1JAF4_9BASI|nr:hypothetical protein MVES_002388 [Malassezia vespertilionis]